MVLMDSGTGILEAVFESQGNEEREGQGQTLRECMCAAGTTTTLTGLLAGLMEVMERLGSDQLMERERRKR